MFKTGNDFIDLLTLCTGVFFPLVPVVIILVRKSYTRDTQAFLMIFCLLNFVRGLLMEILQPTTLSRDSMHQLFTLLDMLVLSLLFKTALPAKQKAWVNTVAIGLLSATVTYFLLRGTSQPNPILAGLVDGFVLVLTAVILLVVVQSSNLQVFQSALFWIAIGTLFFYATALLLEGSDLVGGLSARASILSKPLLLGMANLARYLFYSLAAWLGKSALKSGRSRSALDL